MTATAEEAIKRFAAWARALRLDHIPPSVIRKAKLQIANILAAALAGLQGGGGELAKQTLERSGSGPCTVLAGGKTDAATAYFLNAICSMRHDFDDYLFMGHTGHSSVFASLAACEEAGGNGTDLLRGVVLANELEGRLGASVLVGPHNGQLWAYIHQAGAAAATASILGGTEEEIKNAVALSLYMPSYALEPGFMGGDAKLLTASVPGACGIRAALLALSGARGYAGILAGEKGFLEKFSYLPFPEMLAGFGSSWVTESLSFKPYPGCAYVQSPLDCLMEITGDLKRSDARIRREDIHQIRVKGSILTVEMENMSRPYRSEGHIPPVNVNFSVALSMAVALVGGSLRTRLMTRRFIRENMAPIRKLARKVVLTHDWKYTAEMLRGITAALDIGPLIRDRGVVRTLSAFGKLRKEHRGMSSWREVGRLIGGGRTAEFLRALRSPLAWPSFHLGDARFDRLRFAFGASVEMEMKSGRIHASEFLSHRGAAGRDRGETEALVYGKLAAEAGASEATAAPVMEAAAPEEATAARAKAAQAAEASPAAASAARAKAAAPEEATAARPESEERARKIVDVIRDLENRELSELVGLLGELAGKKDLKTGSE
jgi:2-methylcitrate dehydratase PrpD